MAIFDVNLDLEEKYIKTIEDIYKFVVIIIVFHILVHFSCDGKNYDYGFSGLLFNENFLNTLVIICIAFGVYHLIFKELLNFD